MTRLFALSLSLSLAVPALAVAGDDPDAPVAEAVDEAPPANESPAEATVVSQAFHLDFGAVMPDTSADREAGDAGRLRLTTDVSGTAPALEIKLFSW